MTDDDVDTRDSGTPGEKEGSGLLRLRDLGVTPEVVVHSALLYALTLGLIESEAKRPRVVAELVVASDGNPVALVGASVLAGALERELPGDGHARAVVDCLDQALREQRSVSRAA